MDSSDALNRTRRALNETTANFWTDAEVYYLLSEAERLLAGRLGGVQATTAHTTVTGTSSYAKPTGCLRVDRLTYNGVKLKKGTYRDRDYLDGTNYGSTIQAGKPVMYVEWGANVILYPVPDEAKTIDYMFRKIPTRITNATAFTIQEETLQEMLPDYAVWQCALKDGELARADRHQAAWQANVLRAESIWNDRENQDMIAQVKDEDEYPGDSLGMA